MALDLLTPLRVFLASVPQTFYSIQTLEISHSAMTAPRYVWREPYVGTITTETGPKTVEPLNLQIKLAGSEGNLDQRFDIGIDLTDVEDEFRDELDRIPLATTEKIRIVYREYMSNDLATVMASAVLQAESITYSVGAASIVAVSPRLSITRTGESYTSRDVPMLRGFL